MGFFLLSCDATPSLVFSHSQILFFSSGTAKSTGTFDIPIRFLLDPNINAGKFVQTTMNLAIDCSAMSEEEAPTRGQCVSYLRFDKTSSSEVRFRAAILDEYDWDSGSSNGRDDESSDECLEEE